VAGGLASSIHQSVVHGETWGQRDRGNGRAKQRRESSRGGKVARSTKEGVKPEDAITCRWKASRIVDNV